MFSKTLIASLSLAALFGESTAVPTYPVCHPKVTSEDANFDDLNGIPGSILNPVPVPYKGLNFQGIQFTTVVPTGLAPGIFPHSGSNYGASNLITTTTGGTTMLTTNYPESKMDTFTPKSWYFGCVLQTANGAAAIPVACNINVAGYKGSDNSVANSKEVFAQRFSYNPTTPLGPQQQSFGKFSSECKDIDFLTIEYRQPGGAAATDLLLAIVLDDIKYDIKSKC